jgi:adenylate/nucleoside-diphosphate kinase
MMRVLAELGYRRLKYPTLSSKETALKFLAISLKANNANKDEQYRQKYK